MLTTQPRTHTHTQYDLLKNVSSIPRIKISPTKTPRLDEKVSRSLWDQPLPEVEEQKKIMHRLFGIWLSRMAKNLWSPRQRFSHTQLTTNTHTHRTMKVGKHNETAVQPKINGLSVSKEQRSTPRLCARGCVHFPFRVRLCCSVSNVKTLHKQLCVRVTYFVMSYRI